MQQLLISVLLDDGGRDLARLLGGFALALVMAVLLAVALPLVALTALTGFAGGSEAGPAVARAALAPASPAPGGAATASDPLASSPSESVIGVARRYLGVPYVFGGTNPATGLDCSGLVQLVYRQLGIQLPRTAQAQYDATQRVAREQLQPGDLVFFARTYADPHDWITHVGIYVGDGQQINAPTTGQVVSVQSVFAGFWGAHYAGGGRVRR